MTLTLTRYLREKSGATLEQAARAVSVNVEVWTQFETGTNVPSAATLQNLCNQFKLDYLKLKNNHATNKPTTTKMGQPPPAWILDLPPGTYSLQELVKISQTLPSSTRRVLIKHGGEILEYQKDQRGRHAFYTWPGMQKAE